MATDDDRAALLADLQVVCTDGPGLGPARRLLADLGAEVVVLAPVEADDAPPRDPDADALAAKFAADERRERLDSEFAALKQRVAQS